MRRTLKKKSFGGLERNPTTGGLRISFPAGFPRGANVLEEARPLSLQHATGIVNSGMKKVKNMRRTRWKLQRSSCKVVIHKTYLRRIYVQTSSFQKQKNVQNMNASAALPSLLQLHSSYILSNIIIYHLILKNKHLPHNKQTKQTLAINNMFFQAIFSFVILCLPLETHSNQKTTQNLGFKGVLFEADTCKGCFLLGTLSEPPKNTPLLVTPKALICWRILEKQLKKGQKLQQKKANNLRKSPKKHHIKQSPRKIIHLWSTSPKSTQKEKKRTLSPSLSAVSPLILSGTCRSLARDGQRSASVCGRPSDDWGKWWDPPRVRSTFLKNHRCFFVLNI